MIVGLIDVDNWGNLQDCFPNLPLMKLSAWHKKNGDYVEWWKPEKRYDKVYKSKVFSFTKDIPNTSINSASIEQGGSGYCISLVSGKEVFDKTKNNDLSYEIEHIYPDYEIYGITDTAYGFMSRGCPRGCHFCHVAPKEGNCSIKVSDLSEFWHGQKNIQLMDPNTLACKDWEDILNQLKDSKAYVDFNQGVDVRMLTPEKIEILKDIRIKQVHFAYDRIEDAPYIEPKFEMLHELTGWGKQKVSVYVLTNFNTTLEQDLHRVMFLRNLGFQPYIMRYDKEHLNRGHILNELARWVNTKRIFWSCPSFEQYHEEVHNGKWR